MTISLSGKYFYTRPEQSETQTSGKWRTFKEKIFEAYARKIHTFVIFITILFLFCCNFKQIRYNILFVDFFFLWFEFFTMQFNLSSVKAGKILIFFLNVNNWVCFMILTWSPWDFISKGSMMRFFSRHSHFLICWTRTI